MSIKFFEGFETVGTETGLANQALTRPRVDLRWSSTASGSIKADDSFFLIDDTFSEGYALNMGTNQNFSQANYLRWLVPEEDYSNPGDEEWPIWRVGFRYHVPSTTATWALLVFRGLFGGTNETDVLTVTIIDSTDIRISRAEPGGFIIDTAEDVLSPGSWHYIEVGFVIAEAADEGFVEIRVDGETVIFEEEIDTNNNLTTSFYELRMQHVTTTGSLQDFAAYDDIYIAKDQDFLDAVRVRSLPPTTDVEAGWDAEPSVGTNASTINENGADDTNYIGTDVNNTRDRYNITDPTEEEDILAVKMEAEAINTVGGTPSIFLEVVSGGVIEDEEFMVTVTTDYSFFDMYVESDPAGGEWTISAIEDMRAGVLFKNNLTAG